MRVAVTQFATTSNVQENLASCIRLITQTATCKPSLIVMPEFCNTLFSNLPCANEQAGDSLSYYIDHNQAWNEALEVDGYFLQAIAEQAKQHNCYILINVTLRRGVLNTDSQSKQNNEHATSYLAEAKANISITSCLYSPLGELVHQQDKQTLVGQEKYFFISGNKVPEVIPTPFGKLGLLMANDSMTFEASRSLALDGAQLLCNSLSSYVIDQSCLHDPARAFDNKLFFITANKIGPLLPEKYLLQEEQEEPKLSEKNCASHKYFVGSGQSQIISPDGKILAKLTPNKEGYVFADIKLADAGLLANNKCRPDGTELSRQRRPKLYQDLMSSINKTPQNRLTADSYSDTPVTANVAIFATYKSNEQAIEDVCHYIENNLSDIIQLPELFFIADKTITHHIEQRLQITSLCEQLVSQVSAVLRPFQYLCTSLIIEDVHQAVLISEQGLIATQQQLHFCQRYQWTALGDELNIIDLPLEQGTVKLAMLTADDANIPEIVKVAALNDIQVLLVPFDIQEPSEVKYNLLSRAAENRICIVAASREKSFTNELSIDDNIDVNNLYLKNKVKNQKSTGLIANLTTEPTLLPQWRIRQFNGYINEPIVKLQYGKITKAVIHPIAACTKILNERSF